jgi:2-oxoglutarate dehydrogenase E1 component
MTPKSLLRLPEARSPKDNFLSGKFEEILDDDTISKKSATKIILTSGKVFYDLKKYRDKEKIENTALIRIEQFYPFKKESLKRILSSYPKAEKIVWVQEEPKNMGAGNFLSARINEVLTAKQKLNLVSRPEGASPAVGSAKVSVQQQKTLVAEAFKV